MQLKQRKRKDGSVAWEAYSKAGGRQTYLGTHDTAEAAEHAVLDWEAKVRQHRRLEAMGQAPVPLHGRTYAQAAAHWIESLRRPGVRGHRSRRKYEDQLRLHILPEFGKDPIDSITTARIQTWISELTGKRSAQAGRQDRYLSPQTANTIRIALSSSFTHFVDQGWLRVNPARAVKKLKPQRKTWQWIHSAEDITRLLAACSSDDVRDFIGLAVGTGMRFGELLALHWSDVNLDTRLVCVRAGGRGATPADVRPTKTGEIRYVPILDAALAMFRARRMRAAASPRGLRGYVFASPATGGIRNMSWFRAAFAAAVEASGIHRPGQPKLRVHDLRHTFAAHWVQNGGDIYRLSKVLGHSTVSTTEAFYAHLRTDTFREDYHRVAFALPQHGGAAVIAIR